MIVEAMEDDNNGRYNEDAVVLREFGLIAKTH